MSESVGRLESRLFGNVWLRNIIGVAQEEHGDLLLWHVADVHCAMNMATQLVPVGLPR